MTGRFCTSCGKPFANPDLKFCTGCGAAAPQAPPAPSKRFCTSCGDPVTAGETSFCGQCGASLGGPSPSPAPPPQAPPSYQPPPPPQAPPAYAPPTPQYQPPPQPHQAPAPPAATPKPSGGLPWKSLAAVLVIAGGGYLWYTGAIPDIRWPGGGGGEGGGWDPPDIADIFELSGGPTVFAPAGFLAEGQEITIEESTPPSVPLPEGAESLGPVYEITPPAGAGVPQGGYGVRIPLPDPSVAEDDSKQVYIAHFVEGAWELHPAFIDEEGFAGATLDHFSKIWNIILPRRNSVSAAELSRVRVQPPRISGYTVRGDLAYASVDVSPSRTAHVQGNYRGVKVARLRLYYSPTTRTGMASPRADRFRPYQRNGEDVYLNVGYLPEMLVLDFDPDATMPISRQNNYQAGPWWLLKVAPVFADGSEGPLSDAIRVESGPVEAAWRLRRGVLARLEGNQASEFEQLTWDNPLTLMLNTDNRASNAYFPGSSSRYNRLVAVYYTGRLRNFLALRDDATYSDVTNHEWGHYATHLIYGDDFLRLPGGSHSGWREGDSRSLVWSEDMATYLGQWGTGRGVPEGAGSMYGRWTNMSRDPSGENNASTAWPNVTDMDATRVETIWATALSRLTREVGFSRMYGFLRANHVMDGMAFTRAWYDQGDTNAEMARLQKILLSEGVAWKFRGQVVGQPEEEGAEPIPLEGVAVILQTLHEDQDLYPDVVGGPVPQYTDEDGFFEIWAPPGTVHIALVKTGWEAETYNTHSVSTRGPTNGEVQELEDPLVMIPVEKPVVEILAPSDGDIITERVVTVHGTVTGTTDAKPDGPPITQARMQVGDESYDVAVNNGTFSQDVVLEPGPATITVTAENAGGEGSASVNVEAAIEATILKVTLTWVGSGTDVDLWVTDPEGITTGYTDKQPAEGRQLDIDDTDGFGPETYTMSLPVRGTYQIRVNYFRGEGGESFRLRWVAWEGTEREVRGTESGSLSNADNNGSEASANRRFTVEVR